MEAKENDYVDHRDHKTLDNRKNNLRKTTSEINTKNRKGANRNTTTGHRNVCYVSAKDVYRVQLQVNKKRKHFGDFDNLENAVFCAEYNRSKLKSYGGSSN